MKESKERAEYRRACSMCGFGDVCYLTLTHFTDDPEDAPCNGVCPRMDKYDEAPENARRVMEDFVRVDYPESEKWRRKEGVVNGRVCLEVYVPVDMYDRETGGEG